MLKQKKGITVLGETVVFILFNLIVIVALFLAISRVGVSAALYEQAYAKQLSLLIDGAKEGTIITVDLSELYQVAQSNKLKPEVVIDCENNEVFVRVTRGAGYKHTYFTQLKKCEYSLNEQKRSITIII